MIISSLFWYGVSAKVACTLKYVGAVAHSLDQERLWIDFLFETFI